MLAFEASPPAAAKANPPAQSLPDAAALAAAAKPKRRIPCLRNRRIYEQVVLRKRPQSDVAREFKISQQRVSQIVDQFHTWLTEYLPPGTEEDSAQDQLTLAASHAYLRQEHLFGEAMRRLNQSGQTRVVKKTRYSKTGEELGTHATYYPPSPNSGFMNAALKASQQQWKLAQMAQGLLGRAMEIQFWLPHEYEDEDACAGQPAPSATAEGNAEQAAATAAAKGVCDPQPTADELATRAQQVAAKSCDPLPESHKGEEPKVLWPAGEKLRRGPAATDRNPPSTPAPATPCDRGTSPADGSQQAAQERAKSCEATQPLVTDDEWGAWLLGRENRRARRKQRQKQLAQWKARQ